MKTKLTITVDQQVLQQATRYARSQGVSLSSLVENALRKLADRDLPSFAEKWRGKFMPTGPDHERHRALSRKYG